jgi:hypothetical protein
MRYKGFKRMGTSMEILAKVKHPNTINLVFGFFI